MEHQNWETIIFNKKKTKTDKKKPIKKGGTGNSLDKVDKDEFKIKKVTNKLSLEIKNKRNSKGFTQKELALKINVKPSVINDYESGKAIPNSAIINKLKRILEF